MTPTESDVVSGQWETLRIELRGTIAVVCLSRPASMNAFTMRMADELESFFRRVNDDHLVSGIVVTGDGRAFCAGMDLTIEGNVFGLDESLRPGLSDLVPPYAEEIQRGVRDPGGRVTLAIFDCLKPVVAAINGAAVGIGATMTLAMDARLASESARIGFVFGRIGITPEACSTWFLPRIVGLPTATRLLLSADILDAESALAAGVVDRVVPARDLVDAAVELLGAWIDGRSPVAIALTRQMLLRNSALGSPYLAHALDSLAMFYTSVADGREGVAAFLEKRPARFVTSLPDDLPPFFGEWVGSMAPPG